MTIINSMLDLDDQTRLATFRQIVDTLRGHYGDADGVTDLVTFAPPSLEENGRVLTRRRPLG